MKTRGRVGMSGMTYAVVLVAMIAVSGVAGYYEFSQKDAGGIAESQFSYTLTHSTTHVDVPKGDTLVVIPLGINENISLPFKPLNLKVELGVNSTILFYDNDTYEHPMESTEWPSGSGTFAFWILPHSSVAVQLNVTGTYQYNFEMTPALQPGTITVVSG